MRMTMLEILELIEDIPQEDITKSLLQDLVCRAYKEGLKDQKKIDKELKSELGYSRIGRDAMRRG